MRRSMLADLTTSTLLGTAPNTLTAAAAVGILTTTVIGPARPPSSSLSSAVARTGAATAVATPGPYRAYRGMHRADRKLSRVRFNMASALAGPADPDADAGAAVLALGSAHELDDLFASVPAVSSDTPESALAPTPAQLRAQAAAREAAIAEQQQLQQQRDREERATRPLLARVGGNSSSITAAAASASTVASGPSSAVASAAALLAADRVAAPAPAPSTFAHPYLPAASRPPAEVAAAVAAAARTGDFPAALATLLDFLDSIPMRRRATGLRAAYATLLSRMGASAAAGPHARAAAAAAALAAASGHRPLAFGSTSSSSSASSASAAAAAAAASSAPLGSVAFRRRSASFAPTWHGLGLAATHLLPRVHPASAQTLETADPAALLRALYGDAWARQAARPAELPAENPSAEAEGDGADTAVTTESAANTATESATAEEEGPVAAGVWADPETQAIVPEWDAVFNACAREIVLSYIAHVGAHARPMAWRRHSQRMSAPESAYNAVARLLATLPEVPALQPAPLGGEEYARLVEGAARECRLAWVLNRVVAPYYIDRLRLTLAWVVRNLDSVPVDYKLYLIDYADAIDSDAVYTDTVVALLDPSPRPEDAAHMPWAPHQSKNASGRHSNNHNHNNNNSKHGKATASVTDSTTVQQSNSVSASGESAAAPRSVTREALAGLDYVAAPWVAVLSSGARVNLNTHVLAKAARILAAAPLYFSTQLSELGVFPQLAMPPQARRALPQRYDPALAAARTAAGRSPRDPSPHQLFLQQHGQGGGDVNASYSGGRRRARGPQTEAEREDAQWRQCLLTAEANAAAPLPWLLRRGSVLAVSDRALDLTPLPRASPLLDPAAVRECGPVVRCNSDGVPLPAGLAAELAELAAAVDVSAVTPAVGAARRRAATAAAAASAADAESYGMPSGEDSLLDDLNLITPSRRGRTAEVDILVERAAAVESAVDGALSASASAAIATAMRADVMAGGSIDVQTMTRYAAPFFAANAPAAAATATATATTNAQRQQQLQTASADMLDLIATGADCAAVASVSAAGGFKAALSGGGGGGDAVVDSLATTEGAALADDTGILTVDSLLPHVPAALAALRYRPKPFAGPLLMGQQWMLGVSRRTASQLRADAAAGLIKWTPSESPDVTFEQESEELMAVANAATPHNEPIVPHLNNIAYALAHSGWAPEGDDAAALGPRAAALASEAAVAGSAEGGALPLPARNAFADPIWGLPPCSHRYYANQRALRTSLTAAVAAGQAACVASLLPAALTALNMPSARAAALTTALAAGPAARALLFTGVALWLRHMQSAAQAGYRLVVRNAADLLDAARAPMAARPDALRRMRPSPSWHALLSAVAAREHAPAQQLGIYRQTLMDGVRPRDGARAALVSAAAGFVAGVSERSLSLLSHSSAVVPAPPRHLPAASPAQGYLAAPVMPRSAAALALRARVLAASLTRHTVTLRTLRSSGPNATVREVAELAPAIASSPSSVVEYATALARAAVPPAFAATFPSRPDVLAALHTAPDAALAVTPHSLAAARCADAAMWPQLLSLWAVSVAVPASAPAATALRARTPLLLEAALRRGHWGSAFTALAAHALALHRAAGAAGPSAAPGGPLPPLAAAAEAQRLALALAEANQSAPSRSQQQMSSDELSKFTQAADALGPDATAQQWRSALDAAASAAVAAHIAKLGSAASSALVAAGGGSGGDTLPLGKPEAEAAAARHLARATAAMLRQSAPSVVSATNNSNNNSNSTLPGGSGDTAMLSVAPGVDAALAPFELALAHAVEAADNEAVWRVFQLASAAPGVLAAAATGADPALADRVVHIFATSAIALLRDGVSAADAAPVPSAPAAGANRPEFFDPRVGSATGADFARLAAALAGDAACDPPVPLSALSAGVSAAGGAAEDLQAAALQIEYIRLERERAVAAAAATTPGDNSTALGHSSRETAPSLAPVLLALRHAASAPGDLPAHGGPVTSLDAVARRTAATAPAPSAALSALRATVVIQALFALAPLPAAAAAGAAAGTAAMAAGTGGQRAASLSPSLFVALAMVFARAGDVPAVHRVQALAAAHGLSAAVAAWMPALTVSAYLRAAQIFSQLSDAAASDSAAGTGSSESDNAAGAVGGAVSVVPAVVAESVLGASDVAGDGAAAVSAVASALRDFLPTLEAARYDTDSVSTTAAAAVTGVPGGAGAGAASGVSLGMDYVQPLMPAPVWGAAGPSSFRVAADAATEHAEALLRKRERQEQLVETLTRNATSDPASFAAISAAARRAAPTGAELADSSLAATGHPGMRKGFALHQHRPRPQRVDGDRPLVEQLDVYRGASRFAEEADADAADDRARARALSAAQAARAPPGLAFAGLLTAPIGAGAGGSGGSGSVPVLHCSFRADLRGNALINAALADVAAAHKHYLASLEAEAAARAALAAAASPLALGAADQWVRTARSLLSAPVPGALPLPSTAPAASGAGTAFGNENTPPVSVGTSAAALVVRLCLTAGAGARELRTVTAALIAHEDAVVAAADAAALRPAAHAAAAAVSVTARDSAMASAVAAVAAATGPLGRAAAARATQMQLSTVMALAQQCAREAETGGLQPLTGAAALGRQAFELFARSAFAVASDTDAVSGAGTGSAVESAVPVAPAAVLLQAFARANSPATAAALAAAHAGALPLRDGDPLEALLLSLPAFSAQNAISTRLSSLEDPAAVARVSAAAAASAPGSEARCELETTLRRQCLQEAVALNTALVAAGGGEAGGNDWREDAVVTWAHMLLRSLVFPRDAPETVATAAGASALSFARLRRCGLAGLETAAAVANANGSVGASVVGERRALQQHCASDAAAARRDALVARVYGDGVRAGSALTPVQAVHVKVFVDYLLASTAVDARQEAVTYTDADNADEEAVAAVDETVVDDAAAAASAAAVAAVNAEALSVEVDRNM